MSRTELGKIATLTFHEAYNYGAVLQAYALQRSLMSLGYDSEVLNYSCPAIRKSYFVPNPGFKAKIGWTLRAPYRRVRMSKFEAFKERHLAISDPVGCESLGKVAARYDAIVVGSDQVWNVDLTGGDTAYFLDFVDDPQKKKSYAASIGLTAWDEGFERRGKGLLGDFTQLSVREESAADYLGGLLGRRPEVVCDPVMLLSGSEWGKIAIKPQQDKSYLLIVSLDRVESDCLEWAKSVAESRGLEVVLIHSSWRSVGGAKTVRDAGPEEYLGWIRNADIVVTHSFHACCFSIVFGRDFYWFKSPFCSSDLASRESRMGDLLKTFGIEDRRMSAGGVPLPDIDHAKVAEKLAAYRETSLSYLERII